MAARQNRHRDLANFRSGEDKFHMRGRLFQCFEQRVESVGRQHVNLIDDVNFVTRGGGAIGDRINDFANIADTGAAGSIHLHHIYMAPFHDGCAMFTAPTRIDGWPARAIGADAIHALGNDARSGGFASSTNTGHHEGLGDTIGLKGITQGLDHRVLPN